MARLFEPFSSTKTNGLGLGLFSAKHIVEMHDGLLRVESPAGTGGTWVEVDLPVKASAERSLLARGAEDKDAALVAAR
jgi:signal transduction histidine kinase